MKKQSVMCYIWAALFSISIFYVIYGWRILNPLYVDWLFVKGSDDPAIHYLGWKAFRNSRWLFPIGLTDNLAYPERTSVIFTDSIPLVAVVLKLFSSMLPKDFQYFGIWELFSFVMLSFGVVRILEYYIKNNIVVIISTGLFLISEMFLCRVFIHAALSSQWILLMALELIWVKARFEKDKKYITRCLLIGILASSIHLYYVPMCGICLIGYAVADLIETRRWKRHIIAIGMYIVICFLTVFLLGGFYGRFKTDGPEFLGKTSFNLTSLFNPRNGWSSLLIEHASYGSYQGEGYLGMGGLLLGFSTLVLFLQNGFRVIRESIKNQRFLIMGITVSSLIALGVALSPVITFGNHVLFEIPLPDVLSKLWAVFRSTNRFAWIIEYQILLLCCYIVCSKLGRKEAFILLLFCVIVQAVDLKNKLIEKHVSYNEEKQFVSTLTDREFWGSIEKDERIKEVVFTTYPGGTPVFSITNWCLENGLYQNYFLFGRSLLDAIKQNTQEALSNPSDSQIFLFNNYNRAICSEYNLNYYDVDGYIVGYASELDTKHPKAVVE